MAPRSPALPPLALAAGCLAAAGLLVFLLRGSAPRPVDPEPVDPIAVERDATTAPRDPATAAPPGSPDATPAVGPAAVPAAGTGGSVPPGLRQPSGDDFSDPVLVQGRLRALLAADPGAIRWDRVADLVGVHPGPLPGDVRTALEQALAGPHGAGVVAVYERMRDDGGVHDLLSLLGGAAAQDPVVRARVLVALGGIPQTDPARVVAGLASHLTGDARKDLPVLRAVARRGGGAAAEVLVQAVTRASDAFPVEVARELRLRDDPAAVEVFAKALADPSRSDAELTALATLVREAGASSAALAPSLKALASSSRSDATRKAALSALGATGDPDAVEHLLAAAAAGGEVGDHAAKALAAVPTGSPAVHARLLRELATTSDDRVRPGLVRALAGSRAAEAVAAIADLLATGSREVRYESAVALGSMGATAGPAVPALARAFDGGDETMKSHVAIALASIGTPEAETTLRQMQVAPSSPEVARAIAAALRSMRRK